MTEKKEQIEKIERKFLFDEISKEIHDNHSSKINEEIKVFTDDLSKTEINSSNLEKAVEKCLVMAQNISSTWVAASFEDKRSLQNLIFPQGILYNKQKELVRTEKVNSLFSAIQPLQRALLENKKGNLLKDYLFSSFVPRTGIEPALPCDNQILSLARLPIPPSGLLS